MKNKRSLIMNFGVLTLSVLMIVFMAFDGLGGESGWTTLKEMVKMTGIGIPIAYLVALVLLLIVVVILSILADFKVIKNAKFIKINKFIMFMTASFMLFLFTIVATQLMTMEYASSMLGWASIVNMVFGYIAGITAIVNLALSKRK